MMVAIAKGLLGRLSGRRGRLWLLLGLAALLLNQALVVRLHERLYFWLKTELRPAEGEAGLRLSEYRVQIEALPIVGVAENLSGLSYDDDHRRLWAVINSPPELIALSTHGVVLARYPLQGFEDVEGVAYLGDDQLLLTDERRQELVVVRLPKQPGALDRADFPALTLALDGDLGKNQGFEGVGYDRAGDRLFVVKEHWPRRLYEIRGLKASLAGTFNLTVVNRDEWIRNKNFVTDLSSVEFDAKTGHLILLSEESKIMMELDRAGGLAGYRSLWGILAGLKRTVPHGEGVAIDKEGNLYLVSEPNLFYMFNRDD